MRKTTTQTTQGNTISPSPDILDFDEIEYRAAAWGEYLAKRESHDRLALAYYKACCETLLRGECREDYPFMESFARNVARSALELASLNNSFEQEK